MYKTTTSFIRGMLPFSGAFERRGLWTGGCDTDNIRNRVGSTLTDTMPICKTTGNRVSKQASNIDAPSSGPSDGLALTSRRTSTSTDSSTSSAASSWNLVDVPDIAWPEDPFAFCLDPSVVSTQSTQSSVDYGLNLEMGEIGLIGGFYGSNSEMQLPPAFDPFAAEKNLVDQRDQMGTVIQQDPTYRPPIVYPWGSDYRSTTANAPAWAVVQRPQRQILQAPTELDPFERWELEKNIWAPRAYRAWSMVSTLEDGVQAATDDNMVRNGVECTSAKEPVYNAHAWAVVQRPQRQNYQAPTELDTFERWELEKDIWAPRAHKARGWPVVSILEEAVQAATDDNTVCDGVERTSIKEPLYETFTPADALPLDHPLEFRFANLAIDVVPDCTQSEHTLPPYHRTNTAKTMRPACA